MSRRKINGRRKSPAGKTEERKPAGWQKAEGSGGAVGLFKELSVTEYVLTAVLFALCLTGAVLLPVAQCPDEAVRRFLSDWIFWNRTLPTGNEMETITAFYGFSYALRPFLGSLVAVFFMNLAAVFTTSAKALLIASRLVSVFSITICFYYCLRIGHIVFRKRSSAVLLGVLVCFLPQVMFLGMYQNNDILSLCGITAVTFAVLKCYEDRWSVRSSTRLGIWLSVCLLSYYSVYGWILFAVLFCVAAVLTDGTIKGKGKLLLSRAALIGGTCIVLAGWFFIRNAVLHGDIFGISAEAVSRERLKEAGVPLYQYVCYQRDGLSMTEFLKMKDYEFLRMTTKSFVGVFGNMSIYMPLIRYGIYYALLGLGVVLFAAVIVRSKPNKRDGLLMIFMGASSAITAGLHLWQSYARDYQPQGRYIIALSLLFGFMISYGMDRTELSLSVPDRRQAVRMYPAAALSIIWIVLFARTFFDTMMQMLP